MKKTNRKDDRNDRREDLLRPSKYLGHDRDRLGVHLISRGAYEIAESQLRRAIWPNPGEKSFMAHLAWCLHKQGRDKEAKECLAGLPEEMLDDRLRAILRLPNGTPMQGIAKRSPQRGS